MVHDCGVCNGNATKKLRLTDPAAVMPVSIRPFIREAAQTPIWRWLALRPDLLVNRVRDGFAEFARREMEVGSFQKLLCLSPDDVDQAWGLACWMMVGGIHDIVVGDRALESEQFVCKAITLAWGFNYETADSISSMKLPSYGSAKIDWTFMLKQPEIAEQAES